MVDNIFTQLKENKDIIISLCAMTTVIIALVGLNTWRRQLIGDSRYKLVKQFLSQLFKLEISFDILRSPAIWDYEYPKEKDENFISEHHFVYDNRWKQFYQDFMKLEEYSIELRVEFGDKHKDILLDLRKQRAELRVAIMKYLDEDRFDMKPSSKEYQDNYKIMTNQINEDVFGDNFKLLLREIETKLRPYVNNGLFSKYKAYKIKSMK